MKRVSKIVVHYTDGTTEEVFGFNPLTTPKPLPQIDPYKREAPFPDPYLPKWPEYPQSDHRCPKCGIKIEGVMGYCCPQVSCPCGLGGVTCDAS